MEGGVKGRLDILQAVGHSAQRIATHLYAVQQHTQSTGREKKPF